MNSKRGKGQYYTLRSPFEHEAFKKWVEGMGNLSRLTFWEPFAGANNLLKSFQEFTGEKVLPGQWTASDLEPEAIMENSYPQVKVEQRDSIDDPIECDVIVTNPPYLAKNSAARMGIEADFKNYSDLWEVSIAMALGKADWVAAIIPESFITRGIFRERLTDFIGLTESLFDDTGFPVCLALWTPESSQDFVIWRDSEFLGTFSNLKNRTDLFKQTPNLRISTKYNNPDGQIGIKAIDGTGEGRIYFTEGDEFPPQTIKNSNRSFTRVLVSVDGEILGPEIFDNIFFEELNRELFTYREQSQDVFLTNFKSLRKDGRYRRRLDWRTADLIIHRVLEEKGYVSRSSNLFNLF